MIVPLVGKEFLEYPFTHSAKPPTRDIGRNARGFRSNSLLK